MSKIKNYSKLFEVYPFGDTYSVYSSDLELNKKIEKSKYFTLFAEVKDHYSDSNKLIAKIYMYNNKNIKIKNLKEFKKLIKNIKEN